MSAIPPSPPPPSSPPPQPLYPPPPLIFFFLFIIPSSFSSSSFNPPSPLTPLLLLLIFVYPNMELWTEGQDIRTNCPKLGMNEQTDRRTDGHKKLSIERSSSVKN